jgi:hypothetical protein
VIVLASTRRTGHPARVNVGNESDALAAAASDDVAARVVAGRWLAVNAGAQYQAQLLALLTDSDNTAVSMNTAYALLDNPSEFSVSMVMRALASTDAAGDEETLEHLLFAATPYLFQSSPPFALREALDGCLLTADQEVITGLQLAGLA